MKNYLKFWGTRGSCAVSGSEYQKYGGNTCCLEVKYGETRLFFDAGTGIRPLGDTLLSEGVKRLEIFLSHTHWDHLIGFPFFEPLYERGIHITIYAPLGSGRPCRELFNELLSCEFFPVHLDQLQGQIEFRTLHPKTPLKIGPLTLDFHETNHPGNTLCFKIQTPHQTIGYITDDEMLQGFHGPLSEVPPEIAEPHFSFFEFFKGADTLIHEAQYFPEEYLDKVGWGHSSVRNVAYLLKQTEVPHWIITHHDPKHSDAKIDELVHLAQQHLKEEGAHCKVEAAHDLQLFPLT